MPIQKTTHEYKRINGCSIEADVYLARQPRSPAVLYLHGGALIFGDRQGTRAWQVELLNEAGFTVVSADYRLAPETNLVDIMGDVRDVMAWVTGEAADQLGFDGRRVAVMGSSAGGYLSLMTGTFGIQPRAIVSFFGYGDILDEWYSQPSEHYCQHPLVSRDEALRAVGTVETTAGEFSRFAYYLYTRQQGNWVQSVSGLHPEEDREKLLAYCPELLARPDYPPTMLLHGDADTDVPFGQSVAMHARLRDLGVECQLVTMPGMGHSFDQDGTNPEVQRAMEQVLTFLRKHV